MLAHDLEKAERDMAAHQDATVADAEAAVRRKLAEKDGRL